MSTLKVNSIQHSNGTDALTIDSTGHATFNKTFIPANPLTNRNLIINGDMRIAQRGTSVSGITASGYHSIDRWFTRLNTFGTWTQAQSTDVPTGQGFAYSLKMNCTTADASPAASDYLFFQYKMEGQNVQHLKWGTSSAEDLTLSFWVKSNKTGTYQLTPTVIGSSVAGYSLSYTIDSADTWEKKTITIPKTTSITMDSDNIARLQLEFCLGAGSDFTGGADMTWNTFATNARAKDQTVNLADSTSNYINITGVQLEVGDTATPFEHRPYDMELARCQRYFIALGGQGSNDPCAVGFGAGTTSYVSGWLPTQLRASPTMGYIGSISGLNVTAPGISATVTGVANIGGGLTGYSAAMTHSGSSIGNGVAVLFRTVNAGVYLTLSAEL